MRLYKVISIWEWAGFSLWLALSLLLFWLYFQEISSSLAYKGVKAWHKKDFALAQKRFTQALAKRPFDPWAYMNLGLSHDSLSAPDKALKTYGIVSSHLARQSRRAGFFSHFNQGELNGRLGQLRQALESYQKALDFQYKEKEIKTNIELLFQKSQQPQSDRQMEKQGKNQPENKPDQKNSQQGDDKNPEDQKNTQQGDDKNPEDQKNSQQGDGKNPEDQKNTQQGDGKNPEDQKSGRSQKERPQPSSPNKQAQPGHNNPDLKELSEKEQKAILEEVEKQENKARAGFYRKRRVFGDKTIKDW